LDLRGSLSGRERRRGWGQEKEGERGREKERMERRESMADLLHSK